MGMVLSALAWAGGAGAIEAKCSACHAMMQTMYGRLMDEGPELDLDFSRNRVGEDGKGTGKVVSYATSETRVETVLEGLCKDLTNFGLMRGDDHVRVAREERGRESEAERSQRRIDEAKRRVEEEAAEDRAARGEVESPEEVAAKEAAAKAKAEAKEKEKAERKVREEAEDKELKKKPAEWREGFGSLKKVENVHNHKVLAQFCAVMLDDQEDAIAEAIREQPTPALPEGKADFCDKLCAKVCAEGADDDVQRAGTHGDL